MGVKNKFRGVSLLVFTLLMLLFSSVFASATLFINEVAPNGELDIESEWIEIYNNDPAPFNLSGYAIRMDDGVATYSFDDVMIPANGFILLANNISIFNESFPMSNGTGLVFEYGDVATFDLSDLSSNLSLRNLSTGDDFENFTYEGSDENVSIGRYQDGSANIINLSVLSPLAQNDNDSPDLNSWLLPSKNASNLTGIINVTINITDDTARINSSILTINATNFSMEVGSGDLFFYVWNTTLFGEGPYNLTAIFNDSYGQQYSDALYDVVVDNTAPNTTFIFPQNGFNVSGTLLLNLTVADPTTGTHFVSVRNGSQNWISLNFTQNNNWMVLIPTQGIADGELNLTINATDFAGNSNTAQFIAITVDNSAPSNAFISPSNNSNLSGTVNFTITSSDGTSGVKFVQIRNGTSGNWIDLLFNQGSIFSANYSFLLNTNLLSDGAQIFTINTTDFSGNSITSLFSSQIIDNAAPNITFITPVNLSNASGTVNITLTASDGTLGVSSVRIKNGSQNTIPLVLIGGNSTNGNWSVLLDSTAIPDGFLTLTANASDYNGNSNIDKFLNITSDNTAPQLSLLSPINTSNLSGTITFTISAADATSGVRSVRIRNGTSGNFVSMSLSQGTSANGNWSAQIDSSLLSNGVQTFLFNATDFSGNQNVEVFENAVVDNTAPTITFVTPLNGSNVTGIVNLTFGVSDALSGVKNVTIGNFTGTLSLTLIGGNSSNGNWSILLDTTAFQNGATTNVLGLNATDYAGSISGVLNSFAIDLTVDNSAPKVSVISPQSNDNLSGIINFTISVSDVSTGAKTVLIRNGTSGNFLTLSRIEGSALDGNYSLLIDSSTLPNGAQSFQFNVTDFVNLKNNSESVSVNIDNANPVVSSFTGSVQDGAILRGIVPITTSANDTILGIESVEFQINSTFLVASNSTLNQWSANLNTSAFSDGVYNITALAEDFSGNDGLDNIIISEVMFDGPGADSGTEWVELYNPTNRTINITGWDIQDSGNAAYDISSIVLVSPRSTVIIGENSSFLSQSYGVANAVVDDAFDLQNTVADSITLRDASNNAIDFLAWNNLSSWELVASENRTITRNPVGQDTNQPGDFRSNTSATAGVASNPNFITVTIDNTAPVVAGFNGFASNGSNLSGSRTLNITVSDATTQVSTVRVNLINDSGIVFTFNASNTAGNFWTSSFQTSQFSDGAYNLSVLANDTSGNLNSNELISLTIDNTAPRVQFVSPINNSFTNFLTPIVGFNITDSVSGVNSSSITFKYVFSLLPAATFDVSSQSTTAIPNGFFVNGTVTDFGSAGQMNMTVTAKDLVGNQIIYKWQFSFDLSIPVIASVSINDSDSKLRGSDSVNLTISATNGASGVNSVQVRNGSIVSSLSNVNGSIWRITSTPSALGCLDDGNCTLSVNVTDAAGNSNTSERITFLIDNQNPKVQSFATNDLDNKVRSSDNVQFNITINDQNFDSGSSVSIQNSTSASLSLQSTSGMATMWSITTTPAALGCNLTLGSCKVVAVASDIVGNLNSSQIITLVLDDLSPQISAVSTNDSDNVVRNDTVLSITVNSTDASTVASVSINGTSLTQTSASGWQVANKTSSLCPAVIDASCLLTIVSTDNVSNSNSSVTLSLGIDHTNPLFVSVNTSDSNGIVGSSDQLIFTANITDAFNLSSASINGSSLTQNSATGWSLTNSTSSLGCSSEGSCALLFSATDKAGNKNNQSLTLTIDNQNPQLISFAQSPSQVFNTLNVTLSAVWNDTNGISAVIFEHNASGVNANITGSLLSGNNYTAIINTTLLSARKVVGWKAYGIDLAGRVNETMTTQTFTVLNRAPQLLSNVSNINWSQNTNVTLNLSGFFSDPDGDALGFSLVSAAQNITIAISNSTGIASFSPDKDFNGTRVVSFSATDGSLTNTTNSFILNVTFVNTYAPVVSTIPSVQFIEDDSNTSLNLSQYVTDLDTPIESLTWRVLGNSSIIVRINQTTKIVNLSAAANFNGAEGLTFLASDGTYEDGSNTVTVTVLALNDAPSTPTLVSPSNNSNTSTSTLTLNWSQSSDPEGNAITYFVFFSNTSSPLFNQSTSDRNITVNNLTKGKTYFWNVIASDSFANSSVSQTSQFTSVNNRAPTLVSQIQNVTWLEDTINSSINLSGKFTDEDGDALTYSASTPSGISASINQTTGIVTLTPNANFAGISTITFSATDGTSSANSNTVTLNVINTNDAPSISSFSPLLNTTIGSVSGSQRFDVSFSDLDAGDRPQSSWFKDGTSIAPANSSNVTLKNLDSGVYNITVIVTDNASAQARYEWRLTVSGNVSQGSSGLNSSILQLNESQRQAVSNVAINASTTGSLDFGSSVLNFSGITSLDEAFNISTGIISVNSDQFPGLNRSAALAMNGLSFTKAPLVFMAQGFETTSGGVQCPATICTNIRYDASTGSLRFNVAHFTTFFTQANTTNGAPVITTSAATSAQSGSQYRYDVNANDPDGNVLTFSLTTAPSGMSIGSSTGLITWTPSSSQIGNSSVVVSVSDGTLAATQSFAIKVSEGPKLVIEEVDVKVDGKSSSNLNNGSSINKEAVPGSDVSFKVKVANAFQDDSDIEIEDIEVDVIIEDIDDGDDLEDDAKEFDLEQGDDDTVTVSFTIPMIVDEDTYDVRITAEGKDTNGTTHETEIVLSLEVEKENHELRIQEASLFPAIVRCEGSVKLSASIINTGSEDEDEARFAVVSSDLGFSGSESFELDEGSDDSRIEKMFTIPLSRDLAPGIYSVILSTLYDETKESESKTLTLEKKECIEEKSAVKTQATKTQTVSESAAKALESQIKQQQTQASQVQKSAALRKKTFAESDAYAFVLISAFITLSIVLMLMIAALVIRLRR